MFLARRDTAAGFVTPFLKCRALVAAAVQRVKLTFESCSRVQVTALTGVITGQTVCS